MSNPVDKKFPEDILDIKLDTLRGFETQMININEVDFSEEDMNYFIENRIEFIYSVYGRFDDNDGGTYLRCVGDFRKEETANKFRDELMSKYKEYIN